MRRSSSHALSEIPDAVVMTAALLLGLVLGWALSLNQQSTMGGWLEYVEVARCYFKLRVWHMGAALQLTRRSETVGLPWAFTSMLQTQHALSGMAMIVEAAATWGKG